MNEYTPWHKLRTYLQVDDIIEFSVFHTILL